MTGRGPRDTMRDHIESASMPMTSPLQRSTSLKSNHAPRAPSARRRTLQQM